tara:strand:+ start:302 stop:481 length:180 start_codon:yes stop_codon:yes gene_type:complete
MYLPAKLSSRFIQARIAFAGDSIEHEAINAPFNIASPLLVIKRSKGQKTFQKLRHISEG